MKNSIAVFRQISNNPELDTQDALADLIKLARDIAQLEPFTGMTEPTVIT